jgi:tetratricopeptide (TPR) repeat protein
MQLKVRPHHTNTFPLGAVLIKGASIHHWLAEMHLLKLSADRLNVYAIPGTSANSVWGCIVILPQGQSLPAAGRNQYCQVIAGKLYIPENTLLYPQISEAELNKLFTEEIYFFHPETGMAGLSEPIDWSKLIDVVEDEKTRVLKPTSGIFVPGNIKRLEIQALPPDETLEQLADDSFPKTKKLANEPLRFFEKIKLGLLRPFFKAGSSGDGEDRGSSKLLHWFDRLIGNSGSKPDSWLNKLQQHYENLEHRGKDEMHKLMDLFKNDPDEALKYAIPLDGSGTGRGGTHDANFNMHKRWNDFSLGGYQNNRSSGTGVMADDAYNQLSSQYYKTAQDLVQKGDYRKAAFVYLKLLKASGQAAKTLEDGGLYAEAAAIHLKYNDNKRKAAECYEKGNMLSQAITLYKELDDYEKTGDLYMLLSYYNDAFHYYGKVVEHYSQSGKYVKASLLYRNKMNDRTSAQSMLLKGWNENRDALNCLNNYFQNIEDTRELQNAIDDIYVHNTHEKNKENFLAALKHEHDKHQEIRDRTKEIAYEIIAEQSQTNPSIISSLQHFNKDSVLVKDILRFKNQDKKR